MTDPETSNESQASPEIPKPELQQEPVHDVSHPKVERSKFNLLLLDRDIKLREIQEATGISYPTLIDLSKGRKKKYRPRTLRDIAAYLDVSVSDIIEDGINISDEVTPFEKIIKERGLTVNDVAEATGISYPILQDLKNGKKKNYRERTLRDVAVYLDVKPVELLPAENTDESTESK